MRWPKKDIPTLWAGGGVRVVGCHRDDKICVGSSLILFVGKFTLAVGMKSLDQPVKKGSSVWLVCNKV